MPRPLPQSRSPIGRLVGCTDPQCLCCCCRTPGGRVMADDRLERGAADKQEPALPFRYVVLLGLGYAAALLDRGNVAFAQLEMGQDLGLSAADFGLAAGLFFVPYCLFQVPCVRLMPVLGAHRVLAACLLAWGVASVATSATGSLAELCAARMVLGAFEAGYLPGAVFYLSQCFPAGAVAGPTAALQGLGFVGYALGSLGSGALMQGLGGVAGIRGWRWLFIAQGAPAIIVGAAVLLFLPPPPGTRPGKQMRGVSAFSIAPGRRPATRAPPLLSPRADASPEARLLPDVEAAPLASSHTPAPVSPLGHPPTHPPSPPDEEAAATSSSASQAGEGCASADGGPAAELCAVGARGLTWLFVLNHLSVATLGYMSMFFMPQMVEEMVGDKWSLTQVGALNASPALLYPFAMAASARWCDSPLTPSARVRRQVKAVWGACLTGVACVLAAGLLMLRAASPSLTPTGRVPLSILTILLIMFGYTCTVSAAGPFWALHHAVQPGRLRAISVSLVNALGNIGGFVGPVALGALHDALGPRCPPGTDDCVAQWGWGTTLLSGTVMLILSGVATVAATRIYAKAETMPLNQW